MVRSDDVMLPRVATLALSLSLALVPASLAGATLKPVGDVVPAGATLLIWRSPSTSIGANPSARVVVRNVSVIATIRELINALPVTSSAPRPCPDDMMIPSTLSFETAAGAAPFAKVLFQLGGCPYARVYQHNVAQLPTLGGATLSATYAQIQRLIRSNSNEK